jgi:catechol 2,3-dioxygenase-like lactoylglutathione lyase family enzyme
MCSVFLVCLLIISCGPDKKEMEAVMTQELSIQGNLVFFYYPDLDQAERFYAGILGLEKVLDYGFAKIYRISPSTFIGLVDEAKGMHDPSEPKTVTLSFITREIDEWYTYLTEQGVKMHRPLEGSSRLPIRGFVAYDPAGYFLEFERFLEHPQNERLLPFLEGLEALYAVPGTGTTRPPELGILANIIWLYYRDVPNAQAFYENNFGFELWVDQGLAKLYPSSPTGFIGLVDETRGLHRFSEKKAVNVSFLTDEIDAWYERLRSRGVLIKDPLEDSESIPVRAFVGYDPAGYYIEFDTFLEDPRNLRIREVITQK